MSTKTIKVPVVKVPTPSNIKEQMDRVKELKKTLGRPFSQAKTYQELAELYLPKLILLLEDSLLEKVNKK